MALVWHARRNQRARGVRAPRPAVAYTTVMTTMDRLFKKGLLARRKVGRAFVYAAAATRDEMEGAVATELVQSLLQRTTAKPLPMLSSLVDAVSDRDRALLDELERLIREKRRATDDREKADERAALPAARRHARRSPGSSSSTSRRPAWRSRSRGALIARSRAPASPGVWLGAAAVSGGACRSRSSPRCSCRLLALRAARIRRRIRRHADGASRSLACSSLAGAAPRAARRVAPRGAPRGRAGCARRAPLTLDRAPTMPAFAIDSDAPVMALVGVRAAAAAGHAAGCSTR